MQYFLTHQHIILHLSLIESIGPAVIDAVLNNMPQHFNLAGLYDMEMIDFVNQCGLSLKQAQKIVNGLRNTQKLEHELQLIKKYTINWTTCYDNNYPSLLKEIHRPPTILYWQGKSLIEYEKSIAIVGSRKANGYGKRVINVLAADLIANGYTIISGGALGADTMAHQAALDNNGQTVAVIGSGLLKPYPKSNQKLFDAIITNGGTIVSPFPLQFDALPANFPARNRIIAGLSVGCLVVQAAEKSGSKITAQFALEQGRDVFAVPGPIDDPLSIGCHQLIQQGAKLVGSGADILQEFDENYSTRTTSLPPKHMTVSKVAREQYKVQERIAPDTPESAILTACKYEALSVDDLLEKTELPLQELNNLLFSLQLEGKITQNMIGLWQAP